MGLGSPQEGGVLMAARRLFGARPVGAVALVEAPVSRSFARKARVAFYTVAPLVGLLTAMALWGRVHPVVALVLGVVVGAGVGAVVAVLVLAWPVLRVLWHWAPELVFATVVLGPLARLASSHPLLPLAALLVPAAVVGLVRPVRNWVSAWAWCLVVRHRLRVCFAEVIRSANRLHPGSLPLILWARPTPAGERVWVWLRPGLDLTDLESKADKLAVACWADQVRVVRAGERFAALVRVDVTHRDPLADRVAAESLLRLVPVPREDDVPPVRPVRPTLGLDLLDVPEEQPDPRGARR